MRVKQLNDKWVAFKEAHWKSIVSRFDWEEREYDKEGGLIPSDGCVLCDEYGDRRNSINCLACPLHVLSVLSSFSSFDRPGCFVAIDTLLELCNEGGGVFRMDGTKITWGTYDDAIAKKQIRYIYAWLLSMDSVTPSQLKKLRR